MITFNHIIILSFQYHYGYHYLTIGYLTIGDG